jgi:hypothetical protein
MEEAVGTTSTVAPLQGIESVIDLDLDNGIDVDNLIDSINPIGAPFDPSTPNTEVPTSITCNPNRSPRDLSISNMVNKEDAFDDGYDSDGKMGPFNNRIDKEGQQLFNEDDDDDVGFVAERAIDDESDVGTDTDVADDEVHVCVPIDDDTIKKMNMIELKTAFKLLPR